MNALSNNLIMVDRKKLKNPNGLILGTPGSGKSFSAKREIANAFLVTDDDVIVCNPEAEYTALVQKFEGQVIKVSPSSTQYINPMEENARMAALQKIPQLSGLTVAPIAPKMLEQMRGGRKILWKMKKADPELENTQNIRFITSSYEDRFKIPDGSAVEIEYPNRKFSDRCEYMDEYHLRLGYDVLHICQLAEMLERGEGTCRPEPLITEEHSAWDLGSKGFLAIQTCEDGYDYTLYHKDFTEIDGGQIDNPEISMNAARDQILSDYGFGGRTMTQIDYDELCDRAEDAEISRRESVLGKLSDLSSRTDTPVKAAKAKEAER